MMMRCKILYREPEVDEEELKRYGENVLMMLGTIEECVRKGAIIYRPAETVLGMMRYRGGDHVWPLKARGNDLEEDICGFRLFSGTKSKLLAEVVIFPRGTRFYLMHFAKPLFKLTATSAEDTARIRQIMTEVIHPMVKWLGGSSKTREPNGRLWTQIYLPLKTGPRVYEPWSDTGMMFHDIEVYIREHGMPGGESEYKRCWQKFFMLQDRLAGSEAVEELKAALQLKFLGDVAMLDTGRGYDLGCVEFSETGLSKIEQFIDQLEED